jgi:hypothetical protein
MPKLQQRTISHTGDVLEEDNVLLRRNKPADEGVATDGGTQAAATSPTANSGEPIIGFQCPRKFESIRYNAAKHWTKLVLRTKTVSTSDDRDDTTVSTRTNLTPIAGEEEPDEQPFPVVRAVEKLREDGSGSGPLSEEIEVTDVDYAANEVTLARNPDSDVFLYSVMSRGAVKYQGVNQLDQVEGPVSKWSTPLYRWSDFDQDKRGTEINLDGSVKWTRNERIQLLLTAPDQVIWEDSHYPESYVSKVEQLVEVEI